MPGPLAWLMPYARIRFWYNSGAAFGIFKNGNLVFMLLAVIVAGAILYYFPRISRKDWWLRLALMLQFSGAVGNLTDRIQCPTLISAGLQDELCVPSSIFSAYNRIAVREKLLEVFPYNGHEGGLNIETMIAWARKHLLEK